MQTLPEAESPRRQRATLTIEEVADLLGIGRTTAYALANRDELPVPTIRLGRRLVVSAAQLDRVINPQTDAQGTEIREGDGPHRLVG